MALWAGTEPARVQHGRLPAGDSSGGMWYPRDGGTVSEVASSDSLGPDSLAPDSLAPDSMGLESARPESARVTVFPPGEPVAVSPVNPVVHSGRKLAVIVVNYAAHGLIEHNLAAARLDHRAVRVVLVDNFSSSQEVQAVTALTGAMGWDLVLLGDNGGFGSGVNAGIEEAIRLGSDCFLLINPDARIAADVVAALHEECRNNPLAMVAPRILASDGKVFFDGAVVDVAKGRIRGLGAVHGAVVTSAGCTGVIDGRRRLIEPWLTGACVAFGIDLYRRTGGMDDAFFLYWEDVDLSYRARRAGATLIVRHDLSVIHDEGGSQGARVGRAKSALYYYFNCRNRLVFAANHLPKKQLAWWIARTPGASWAILMQGGRRQLLDSPALLFAAVRGSCAGLAVAIRALADPNRPPAMRAGGSSGTGAEHDRVRQS